MFFPVLATRHGLRAIFLLDRAIRSDVPGICHGAGAILHGRPAMVCRGRIMM